jgi:septum formation inhibitor MinC
MKKNIFMTAGFVLIMIFLISACMPDSASPEKSVVNPTSTAGNDNLNNPEAEVSSETETPTGMGPAQDEPTEENEKVPTSTVRSGLEATDPNTVQIAAGDVQLIEFFAFW